LNEFERLGLEEFTRLSAGDPGLLQKLAAPARLAVQTPYVYSGRGGMVVYLVSDGTRIRLSEGGQLLKYLESQGMDLSMDLVLSKTVYHAIQETPGTQMGNGQVYIDTTPDRLSADLPRFIQTLLEVAGLRHAKYKEALVQLSRASARLELEGAPPMVSY
jgi:hypothetical protein